MAKRRIAALICLCMALVLLPAAARAAGGSVTIKGAALTPQTPYYVNDSGAALGTEPAVWNAWFDVENSTLYLKNLTLSTVEGRGIQTSNIDTLCLDLEGVNSVTTTNSDLDAAAIGCNNLIVCGDGKLTAKAQSGGYGIAATGSITLQYPVELTVEGAVRATNAMVKCSEGANSYNAARSDGGEITDYFNNLTRFESETHVSFTPRTNAFFPLWVDGQRVTAQNMGSLPVSGGSAAYTPARGNAPARLTLTGAAISHTYTNGDNNAAVYAEESLEIYLIGSNSIDFFPPSNVGSVYGVFAPALTITADPGASLRSNVTAPRSSSADCYGIRGAGNITINGGEITVGGFAATGSGAGIYSDSTLSVNGGAVTAESAGDGANSFAVRAQALTLGTGMAILTPAGGKAPKTDSAQQKAYVMDNAENGAQDVEIGPARCTVTFDKRSGTGGTASVTATFGNAMPAATMPTRAGYSFTGYYDAAAGGKQYYTAAGRSAAVWDKSENATLYAQWAAAFPSVDSVRVSPATASVPTGGAKTFIATVTGANNPAQTVTWSVAGSSSFSTTISGGVLIVGEDETAASLTVKATSSVDPGKFGTAIVTVTASPIPPDPDPDPDPDPIQYQITKGPDGEWTQGSSYDLRFTVNADYGKFKDVWVDGARISNDKYTAQSGTTITLNASYLSTLTVGRHTLRVNFTDGYVETDFIINAADISKPGDTQFVLWLGIVLIAGAGLAVVLVRRRRRKRKDV